MAHKPEFSIIHRICKQWFLVELTGANPVLYGEIGGDLYELKVVDNKYQIILCYDVSNGCIASSPGTYFATINSALGEFDMYYVDDSMVKSAMEMYFGKKFDIDAYHEGINSMKERDNYQVIILD